MVEYPDLEGDDEPEPVPKPIPAPDSDHEVPDHADIANKRVWPAHSHKGDVVDRDIDHSKDI